MTVGQPDDQPQDADGPGGRTQAPPAAFGPDDGLTPKQGRAVDALLRESTTAKAAAAAGVNERTLRRWAREPAFRSAVLRGRREAFGQSVGLTHRYAPVAVATLVKVMQDPMSAASAKVTAAATALLKFGREGVEIDDLAERVERLEAEARPRRAVVSRAVEPPEPLYNDDDDDDEEEDDEGNDEAPDGVPADGDQGEPADGKEAT